MRTLVALIALLVPTMCVAGECTDEMIQGMKAAGMSKAEVQAACDVSTPDFSWLAGEWRVLINYSNYQNPIAAPDLSYWYIEVAGGRLTISVKNTHHVALEQETVAPYIFGSSMEFEFLDLYYVLNLVRGERVDGQVFNGVPGIARQIGRIQMRR